MTMNHFLPALLLILHILILPCWGQNAATAQPPGLEGIDNPDMSRRLIHYWADYSCYVMSDNSEPNIKEQCKEACFPGGVESDVPAGQIVLSSQTCWLSGPEVGFPSGQPLTDEEKKKTDGSGKYQSSPCIGISLRNEAVKSLTTGYCVCDDPIVNILGDFFIKSVVEMGKILQKVMCPTLMALDLVVEIGSAAIPGVGKAITVGMRTGVKTAKMFKHAYNAEEAAAEWASMFVDQGFGLASEAGCKAVFKFSKADLAKRFLDFADAPDELVPGINYEEMPCPKGKKASKECKKKNGEDDRSDVPSKTQASSPPASTTTSSQASTPTSTVIPQATRSCDSIGRNDLKYLTDMDSDNSGGEMVKRTLGMAFHDRRLQERAPQFKRGDACKFKNNDPKRVTLLSKKYPPSGDPFMIGKPAFGFKEMNGCSDYTWGEQQSIDTNDYGTEHVLEWSTVRNFFTAMNSHPDFKDGFEDPDPEPTKARGRKKPKDPPKDATGKVIKPKLDFCGYWKSSWDWTVEKEGMPNPDPAAPVATASAVSIRKTPLQWLAEVYPYWESDTEKGHEDEFVLLQNTINSHSKTRMFSNSQIWDDRETAKMILRTSKRKQAPVKEQRGSTPLVNEPLEQPKAAVQRLRNVIGAYLYLKEPRVNNIFVAQVDRIGAQLQNIENTLKVRPRSMPKLDPTRIVNWSPWKPLGLKEKWFVYMNERYDTAHSKSQKFMKDNIERLNAEYNDAKLIKQADIDKVDDKKKKQALQDEKKLREDMKDIIKKLEDEWAKTKDWPRPKWNAAAQVPASGT
ncbi:hypothetical protein NX059_006515 [Plenodomus lindquistii]|nr:hypothetical protein NX059_006515 [Plenodomus lindquistii]